MTFQMLAWNLFLKMLWWEIPVFVAILWIGISDRKEREIDGFHN